MKQVSLRGYQTYNGKKMLEEAKESLRSDEAVYAYIRDKLHLTNGQVEDNLAVLLDFQEDFHYCDSCPGFDKCDKNEPHYQMRLNYDGKMVVREFYACPKLKEKQEYAARFLRHDFPDEWNNKDARSVDWDGERKKILAEFQNIVKGKSDKWLYIKGNSRSGKSFILAALANTFSLTYSPVAFCDCATLVERLKTYAFSKRPDDKETLAKAMEAYSNCPLLVLDGFGNEFKSEYVYSALLFPILSSRRQKGLLTAFGSDFSISEIMGEYKTKIGQLRTKQFENLLKGAIDKEYELVNLGVY